MEKTKTTIPPKFAQRILLRFLRHDLMEEVQGDLEEKFYGLLKERSAFRAKLNYWFQVLQYVRPFAMRKTKTKNAIHYAMFQNYFKIGYRNLLRNKGYSFINIGGLAAGMAVAMLIGLWIHDELSFDQYHSNYHRICQVMQHQTWNGVTGTGQAIPRPLETTLRSTYGSDFQYMSIARWTMDHILTYKDRKISKSGNFFQEGFPEMLSLRIIKGSSNGLHDPTSILLSESTAKALFGSVDPINQPMIVDKSDVKVIGVYEDLPYNTAFKNLEFIASWELQERENWIKRAGDQWGNNSFQMFVQLAPNADINEVNRKIKKVKVDNARDEAEFNPEIFLFPMEDWHLRSEWKDGKNDGGRIQSVWLFGMIGIFVLLLACINFMNLSTARSEKRAKEVGIRMTMGSLRSQLINQFLSESFLVVVLSFVFSLGLVLVTLPWFNNLADKRILIPWTNPLLWVISVMFILFTSLIAGSYPALYLSSFKPVKVLKGAFKIGKLGSLPRQVLVVLQFTVSVTLIIGTIIVYQQIQFTRNRPIGYDRQGLIMIQMKTGDFYGKSDVLQTALKSIGAAEEFAHSSSPMTWVWSNSGGFSWEGKDPALQTDFSTIWVSPEYGKTVNWKIKKGRDFSREFSTDSSAVLLNEAALKFMGIKEPLNMEIRWFGDTKYHVIGVVQDIVMESPYDPVRPAIYFGDGANSEWYVIKLNPEKSASESIALVESVFKKHIPSAPFDYEFVDQGYAGKFAGEERIGKLSLVFSILAILISCLGLFALASFVAEQRTKEIGIRKVVGASVISLCKMLSRDFVVLVLISCVISIPLAIYFLEDWLSRFNYHTEIHWWIFAIVVAGAVVLTLLTVSFQAMKVAMRSPVKSLRSE